MPVEAKLLTETRIRTGMVRFSYANVWEPKAIKGVEDGKKKYSISIIIPKKDKQTLAIVAQGLKNAKELGKKKCSKWGGTVPTKNFKLPLHDGDVDYPNDPAYANSYYISANSDDKPNIVDINNEVIVNRDEFYSGCYGRASVNFSPYDKGSNGIGAYIGNLQKLKDGESLAGGSTADEDFDDRVILDEEGAGVDDGLGDLLG